MLHQPHAEHLRAEPVHAGWAARAALLALVLALVLLCACERSSDVARDVFGGAANLDVLRQASAVQAYRVDASSMARRWGRAAVDEYPVLGVPITVDAATAQELVAILTAARTYDWSVTKGCVPTPGVGLRFTAGGRQVDVLLCFDCDILGVFAGGTLVGGEDFDPVRPKLVRIVRTLFPEDPAIQALRETR